MADMLASGLSWLTKQLTANASQFVTIARGVSTTENVPATLGNKLLRIIDGFGNSRIEWTDLDLLIPAINYKFNDSPSLPSRGDLAFIEMFGQMQTFEVMPYGDDPPWRWSDPHQSMLRIHYKHTSSQPNDYPDH